jgi:hypothetical protein
MVSMLCRSYTKPRIRVTSTAVAHLSLCNAQLEQTAYFQIAHNAMYTSYNHAGVSIWQGSRAKQVVANCLQLQPWSSTKIDLFWTRLAAPV